MSTPRKISLLEKTTLSTRSRTMNPKALALLDILIGMALFALIAIIAVVSLGQLRQRAYMTGATEDAKSLGIAIESLVTTQGTLPPAAGVTQASGSGDVRLAAVAPAVGKKIFTMTKGNTMTYTYVPPTATVEAGFIVCVLHEDDGNYNPTDGGVVDAWARYSSIDGGITAKGDSSTGACT